MHLTLRERDKNIIECEKKNKSKIKKLISKIIGKERESTQYYYFLCYYFFFYTAFYITIIQKNYELYSFPITSWLIDICKPFKIFFGTINWMPAAADTDDYLVQGTRL